MLVLGVLFTLSPTDVTLRSGVKVAPRPKKPTGHSLINPSSKRYSGLSFCHHADKFLDSDFCFPLIQEKSSHRSGIRGQLAQLAPLLQVHHDFSSDNMYTLTICFRNKFKKDCL